MRKKVFLTGIISLALMFTLAFSSCKTDDDGGGGGGNNNNNGGGGGDSLVGTWGDSQNLTAQGNLTKVVVFTDTAVAGAAGKYAYYLSVGSTGDYVAGVNTEIPIGANAPRGGKNYFVAAGSKQADQFTLKDYGTDPTTNTAKDVVFKRAKGTSGSDYRGIWESDVLPSDSAYTILLIGGVSTKRVWSAHGNTAKALTYQTSVDPASSNTLISWNGAASVQYSKNTIGNNTTLSVPPPGGGQDDTFSPLFSTATF